MRPTEFLYNIIDDYAPMQEIDRTELRRDAQADYIKIKEGFLNSDRTFKEGFSKENLTLKQKLIYWGESWPVRTLLALLFIGCKRWIGDWVNPPMEEEEPEFEEV